MAADTVAKSPSDGLRFWCQARRTGQQALLYPLFDSRVNERGRMHLIATATLADDPHSDALVRRAWLPSVSDANETIVGIALDRARGCHV